MHRFFCPNEKFNLGLLLITDPREIHHLKNVLRLKVKDKIAVFNGQGTEASGTIVHLQNNVVRIQIEDIHTDLPKTTTVFLACAIPKKAKFEFIIEKCTELGVDQIIPLKTKRTEISSIIDRAQKKHKRYEAVAINAAKQCQRKTAPFIHPVTHFADAVKTFLTPETVGLISCLCGKRQNLYDVMRQWNQKPKTILFFIGPEGDFTSEELVMAVHAGAIAVSLGPRVLKVDTAAVSAIAFANFFLNL